MGIRISRIGHGESIKTTIPLSRQTFRISRIDRASLTLRLSYKALAICREKNSLRWVRFEIEPTGDRVSNVRFRDNSDSVEFESTDR